MRIGELSSRTGASTRSLRYYEQQGLLHAVRMPNGYRAYPEETVQRVRNIQDLISVGFGVEEIRDFADCLDHDMRSKPVSPLALRILDERARVLDERIGQLVTLRERINQQLNRIRAEQTSGRDTSHEEAV